MPIISPWLDKKCILVLRVLIESDLFVRWYKLKENISKCVWHLSVFLESNIPDIVGKAVKYS